MKSAFFLATLLTACGAASAKNTPAASVKDDSSVTPKAPTYSEMVRCSGTLAPDSTTKLTVLGATDSFSGVQNIDGLLMLSLRTDLLTDENAPNFIWSGVKIQANFADSTARSFVADLSASNSDALSFEVDVTHGTGVLKMKNREPASFTCKDMMK